MKETNKVFIKIFGFFIRSCYFCHDTKIEKMSENSHNILQYTIALVADFASHYGISQRQALNYLVRFKGFKHLQDYYEVLHTFSFEDSIASLAQVCRNNGGKL